MSNIIQFPKRKDTYVYENEGTTEERIARIKASMERINKLMQELKDASDK